MSSPPEFTARSSTTRRLAVLGSMSVWAGILTAMAVGVAVGAGHTGDPEILLERRLLALVPLLAAGAFFWLGLLAFRQSVRADADRVWTTGLSLSSASRVSLKAIYRGLSERGVRAFYLVDRSGAVVVRLYLRDYSELEVEGFAAFIGIPIVGSFEIPIENQLSGTLADEPTRE